MEGRPALIIAAPWPYHPSCGIGGGVVCYELLWRLSSHFAVHFLSFDKVPNDPDLARPMLERCCASVTLLPCPVPVRGPAERWHQAMQVFRRAPREVRDLDSPAMAKAIRDAVARHDPAAVMLQFPQMAQYVEAAAPAPVVMDTQDLATVSRWREWRSARGKAKRAARAVSWLAWARLELHAYARSDALLAISETDLGVLRAFLPEVPALLSPVAIEVPAEIRPVPDGQRVAFIGNFDHAPNRDALDWVLAEIWPRLRHAMPEAELHVAGPNVPEHVGTRGDEGVVARGFVPDLDDFFGQAQVALVPYRFGGGTKIKALDAMARGCPVVATSVGAEGLRATPGVHLRIADNAEDFAAAAVDLLRSEPARRAQADAARRHVAEHFSWDAKVGALVELMHALRTGPRQAAGAHA